MEITSRTDLERILGWTGWEASVATSHRRRWDYRGSGAHTDVTSRGVSRADCGHVARAYLSVTTPPNGGLSDDGTMMKCRQPFGRRPGPLTQALRRERRIDARAFGLFPELMDPRPAARPRFLRPVPPPVEGQGRRSAVRGYVAQRRNRFYAVIYEGIDPVTGRERRRLSRSLCLTEDSASGGFSCDRTDLRRRYALLPGKLLSDSLNRFRGAFVSSVRPSGNPRDTFLE